MGQRADERPLTGLCMTDSMTGRIAATMVPKKGGILHPYPCAWLASALEDAGHGEIVLRSDQEASILDLKKRAAKKLTSVDFVMEESPVRGSQANGAIETMNLVLANKVRTIKDELDFHYDTDFESQHPIVAWLIPYAATMYNLHKITASGKTPFECREVGPSRGISHTSGRTSTTGR